LPGLSVPYPSSEHCLHQSLTADLTPMPKAGPLALVVAARSLTLAASADAFALFQRSVVSSLSEEDKPSGRHLPGGWLSEESGLYKAPPAPAAAAVKQSTKSKESPAPAQPDILRAIWVFEEVAKRAVPLITQVANVTQCGNISSPILCQQSSEKYNLTCAGWSGKACVAHGQATCLELVDEGACLKASDFGVECVGWGGASCLHKDAPAALIRDHDICLHAKEKLGIPALDWVNQTCLDRRTAQCGDIKHHSICGEASERFGMDCAGWGGAHCLKKGAPPAEILNARICQHSAELLGIPSGGWSGTECLPAGPASCHSITVPGVCNDAVPRLGIKCGWSGDRCISPQEATCERMNGFGVCIGSARALGLKCAWSSESHTCTTRPDAAAQPAEQPHETRLAASG